MEYPVSLLPHAGKLGPALRADGYKDLREVPVERLSDAMHQRVHKSTVTGETFRDGDACASLRAQSHPIAYLDFETLAPPIPEVIGARPYQQVPFQWSLHVEKSAGVVEHSEYLATSALVNLRELAERLIAAVPVDACVLAYNAPFEKKVLLDLAVWLPDLSASLTSIADRLEDLLPVARASYYHPAMKGSWSFKAVLPTIDRALDYSNLADVGDGEDAQVAFVEYTDPGTSAERRARLRESLLQYCGRDTWGMVVLRRYLLDTGGAP